MSETSTLIQSRRVWLAGQFSPLQLEIKDGRIDGVYPYARFYGHPHPRRIWL